MGLILSLPQGEGQGVKGRRRDDALGLSGQIRQFQG
jgi:hypothetical protein